MLKKSKKQIVIALALVGIMTVAGTAAYFSAQEEILNTWTVGKISIDLQEPEYEENKDEETKDILPNEELHKDPQVLNTGNNEAFVFMKVTIPKANVLVANQDGTKPASASLQELFDYKWNTGWTAIDSKEVKSTDGKVCQEYVVVYGSSSACTALKEGETTPVLFANGTGAHIANPGAVGMITFKNIIEGQGLENVELKVNVESYAIQTSNLTADDTTNPAKVWAILSNQAGA